MGNIFSNQRSRPQRLLTEIENDQKSRRRRTPALDGTAANFERKPSHKRHRCPSCEQFFTSSSGRQIRGLEGERITICVKCYNQGPVVVGNNLRRISA